MNPLDLYRRDPFHIRVLETPEEFQTLCVPAAFGSTAWTSLDRALAEPHGVFLVIGQRGTGKSTLFRYMQHLHPEHRFLFLDPPAQPSWRDVQQQGVTAWNQQYPETPLSSLRDLPVALPLGQKLIGVLDDLEKIPPQQARTLLLTAPQTPPGGMMFLLGVEPSQVVEIAGQIAGTLRVEPVDVIGPGPAVLREIAHRRLELYEGSREVPSAVLDLCAQLANGVVREFLRLLQLLFRRPGEITPEGLQEMLEEEGPKHRAHISSGDLQRLHRLFRGLELPEEQVAELERQHLILPCPPDQRWETVWFVKHHLTQQEQARQQSLQTLWEQAQEAPDPNSKGDLFERFILALMQDLDGAQVIERRLSNLHEEYDLLVDVRRTPRLAAHAPFLFVECKNWNRPVGAPEIRNFGWKLLTKRAAFGSVLGLLFAVKGFTSGAEEVLKEAALLGVPLVALQDVAAWIGVDLEKSLDTQIVAQKMAR